MAADADTRAKDHAFNVGMAIDHGIPAALLYHDIDFWCQENLDKKQNIRDGCAWMYRSIADFLIAFPYLSKHIIADGLKTLEDAGLIIVGNYNRIAIDRTKWYTTQVELFSPDCSNRGNGLPNWGNGLPNRGNGESDSGNGLLDVGNGLPDSGKAFPRSDQPIPSITQPITTPVKTTTTESIKTAGKSSSTGGGGKSTTRQAAAKSSNPYIDMIRRKTTGFNSEQLTRLVGMGDSESAIASDLYTVPDSKPVKWTTVYQMRVARIGANEQNDGE